MKFNEVLSVCVFYEQTKGQVVLPECA